MDDVKILQGDCIECMRTLPDESVHCCITSPPYYGLRDYGTAQWIGGDPTCKHTPQKPDGGERANRTLPLGRGGVYRRVCGKCGAVRVDNQIGIEPTPQAYVEKLVAVFAEVWRVLRKNGTVWLVLGDSYFGANWRGSEAIGTKQATNRGANGSQHSILADDWRNMKHAYLKPKDLIGIPWRVAFALQSAGWYLRQDIIWSKPNPMPESVKDRCTKSHEYIFLLSKSARYYYDAEAIEEMAVYGKDLGLLRSKKQLNGKIPDDILKNRLDVDSRVAGTGFRNRRSVWIVATHPYSGAHFAVFPPKLIEPCILAGCPVGGTVLDPFNGSGTTGEVALKNGRKYIGCELNPDYIKLTYKRLVNLQINLNV
jgi:DNA modification methylase